MIIITNLVFNYLIRKIVWSSFNRWFAWIIMYGKHVWHIYRGWYKICSFINLYVIHQHIFPFVKFVFNFDNSCMNCTSRSMNEFHMITIMKLFEFKFMIMLLKKIYIISMIVFHPYDVHEREQNDAKFQSSFYDYKMTIVFNNVMFDNPLSPQFNFIILSSFALAEIFVQELWVCKLWI